MDQTEILKSVRETFHSAQVKATARIDAFNVDAKKAFTELVEKGRTSQKDIAERLGKAGSELEKRVKPVADGLIGKVGSPEVRTKVEEIGKKAKEAQSKAIQYVDTTSREQAAVFAGELRKLADRLEKLSQKPVVAPVDAPPSVH